MTSPRVNINFISHHDLINPLFIQCFLSAQCVLKSIGLQAYNIIQGNPSWKGSQPCPHLFKIFQFYCCLAFIQNNSFIHSLTHLNDIIYLVLNN